jgi:hypothetical protein
VKKVIFFLLWVVSIYNAQGKIIYKDLSVSIENRVEDLFCRMTLDEKIEYIGGTVVATKVNERFGIPAVDSQPGLYEELIKLNKTGTVSFKYVAIFNMSEISLAFRRSS